MHTHISHVDHIIIIDIDLRNYRHRHRHFFWNDFLLFFNDRLWLNDLLLFFWFLNDWLLFNRLLKFRLLFYGLLKFWLFFHRLLKFWLFFYRLLKFWLLFYGLLKFRLFFYSRFLHDLLLFHRCWLSLIRLNLGFFHSRLNIHVWFTRFFYYSSGCPWNFNFHSGHHHVRVAQLRVNFFKFFKTDAVFFGEFPKCIAFLDYMNFHAVNPSCAYVHIFYEAVGEMLLFLS
ncbi:hypothetical protein SRABI80_04526 [Peribacillus frigoritolerans]|nr:hypothetical protein SRABI80_04526 [Peribacillus frigoritolerans]